MGGIVIELNARDQEVWKGRRWNTWYTRCQHNSARRGWWNVDRDSPSETAESYNKYDTTNGGGGWKSLGGQFRWISQNKRKGGEYIAIVLKLPEWKIVTAVAEYATDLPVNEAEYLGLLLDFDLLANQTRGPIIIGSDSNLVIRQMRNEIDCKAPGLQLLRHKPMEKLRSWPIREYLYMKR